MLGARIVADLFLVSLSLFVPKYWVHVHVMCPVHAEDRPDDKLCITARYRIQLYSTYLFGPT